MTINEEGLTKKCMVPLHWVDGNQKIVYWPPKGKKPIHYYTSKWATPDMSWQEFDLLKICLEKGTKDMCNNCMNIDSEYLCSDVPEGMFLSTLNSRFEFNFLPEKTF